MLSTVLFGVKIRRLSDRVGGVQSAMGCFFIFLACCFTDVVGRKYERYGFQSLSEREVTNRSTVFLASCRQTG